MSENTKIVLLAFNATLLTLLTPIAIAFSLYVRNRLNSAATAATEAKAAAAETSKMVNGRMDDFLTSAIEKAYLAGAMSAAKKMVESPHVGVEAKEATKAMAATMKEAKDVAQDATSKKPPSDFPPSSKVSSPNP